MKNLDFGVIGNCRSAALVYKDASIQWFCFPDFDSPSIFSKILDDKKGGEFSILVSQDYKISQNYVKNTNILNTRFESKHGIFEVIDFMPRYKPTELSYFAPPEIYRYIRYISGKPSFKILYDPKFNYAKEKAKHDVNSEFIKTHSYKNEQNSIFLYSDLNFEDIINGQEIFLNEDRFLLLSYHQKLATINIERVYLEYQRTKTYWLNWTYRNIRFKEFSYEINRSMLVLKLMLFQETGAVLAAITTSIPETIGEERNWDYRFCWLRDASMSIDTMLKMGHASGAKRFLKFVKSILTSKHDQFQIMYGIRGERKLTEKVLEHLSGFENTGPVRIGNAAYIQKQNDSFGYLLNVILQYYKFFPGTLDEVEEIWEVVRNIMQTIRTDWEKPDKGIWEIRNEAKHFVFSKIMCWVATDRAIQIAHLLNKKEYVEKWQPLADEIKKDVLEKGWNKEVESFTQTYCNTDADASLLLMETYGFIEASDIKYQKTVRYLKEKLLYKGLMYRYVTEDDFGKPSSAFTICTFWLIEALYKIGEKEEALKIFKEINGYTNHLGLFSEDLDFNTKRQLGNFPQAYSHLALINTASLFSEKKPISKFIQP